MRQCAALHGTVPPFPATLATQERIKHSTGCQFETTIPTIGEKGFTLEKIILWATSRTHNGGKGDEKLPPEESICCRFLERCFELDPAKRISAEEATQHWAALA